MDDDEIFHHDFDDYKDVNNIYVLQYAQSLGSILLSTSLLHLILSVGISHPELHRIIYNNFALCHEGIEVCLITQSTYGFSRDSAETEGLLPQMTFLKGKASLLSNQRQNVARIRWHGLLQKEADTSCDTDIITSTICCGNWVGDGGVDAVVMVAVVVAASVWLNNKMNTFLQILYSKASFMK
ncbi:hypothetical protein T4A_2296 [Trichinella pseudospiralis]|uniref:Uncharacterized protein n=1 Tax=Trichinella pseudospiralis TaxID=6337 RepID=A0A0V1F3W0_TRIPS|nr:hypothetical protein T4A_2296 [Trichinella pseudospiralis]